MFTAEMYVFCDESGTNRRNGARRTGWAPRGTAPWMSTILRRGNRHHLLPAITIDGLLELLVYKGTIAADGFVTWLKNNLLPKMNPFPAKNSILVMDNVSFYHDPRVHLACRRHGVLLWFLPPYSPDFNPIEAYFGDVKSFIRRYYQWSDGDALTEEEFKAFLDNAAREVGDRVHTVRGHFKAAHLVSREEEHSVDYSILYSVHLAKYIRTGDMG